MWCTCTCSGMAWRGSLCISTQEEEGNSKRENFSPTLLWWKSTLFCRPSLAANDRVQVEKQITTFSQPARCGQRAQKPKTFPSIHRSTNCGWRNFGKRQSRLGMKETNWEEDICHLAKAATTSELYSYTLHSLSLILPSPIILFYPFCLLCLTFATHIRNSFYCWIHVQRNSAWAIIWIERHWLREWLPPISTLVLKRKFLLYWL